MHFVNINPSLSNSPDSRPVEFDVNHKQKKLTPNKKAYTVNWAPYFKIIKQPSCFLMFCDRTLIGVEYNIGKERKRLGYIVDATTIYYHSYEIYTREDSHPFYKVTGCRYQCGFYCHLGFCCCDKVAFEIQDCKNRNMKVGEIIKVNAGTYEYDE